MSRHQISNYQYGAYFTPLARRECPNSDPDKEALSGYRQEAEKTAGSHSPPRYGEEPLSAQARFGACASTRRRSPLLLIRLFQVAASSRGAGSDQPQDAVGLLKQPYKQKSATECFPCASAPPRSGTWSSD